MNRFWLSVFAELAKDALCDLAMQIELGRPPIVALHVALHDIETTLASIQSIDRTMGDEAELASQAPTERTV